MYHNGARLRVTVSNAAGSVDSVEAVLNVILDPMVIQAHPQNATASVGSTATFNVNATGSELVKYQWLVMARRRTQCPMPAACRQLITPADV